MGLLDDAIREHLDLKRQRGADPGEIARVEQEALEPVFPDEPADGVAPDPSTEHETPIPDGAVPGEIQPESETLGEASTGAAGAPADLTISQETAELDMQAFLDAELQQPADSATPASAHTRPVRATPSSQLPEQASMEWEVPGSSRQQQAESEQVPGQERMSFE